VRPLRAEKISVATVLDRADHTEVEVMSATLIMSLRAQYMAANYGELASPEEENDTAQLTALKYKLDAGMVPYADFTVYRPEGHRPFRGRRCQMQFQAHIWDPGEETFKTMTVPGPPDLTEWLRCWDLYTCGLKTLKAASGQRMDKYREKIRSLAVKYSNLPWGGGWWLIAIADVRMRSERVVQLRQLLEEDDTERRAAGQRSYFDRDKPWDCVFFAAAQDTEFWDTEVREKASAFTTHIGNLPEREGEGCSPEAGHVHAADSIVQSREGRSPPPPRARQSGGVRRPWGEGKTNKARKRARARAVCPSMRIRMQPGAKGCVQYVDGLAGPLDCGRGRDGLAGPLDRGGGQKIERSTDLLAMAVDSRVLIRMPPRPETRLYCV